MGGVLENHVPYADALDSCQYRLHHHRLVYQSKVRGAAIYSGQFFYQQPGDWIFLRYVLDVLPYYCDLSGNYLWPLV